MCVYCSKLKENDSKRIYVQINTYRVYIDIPYTFINCSLNLNQEHVYRMLRKIDDYLLDIFVECYTDFIGR